MPPAPGNETVQQMLADGGKASMVAMTLGLGKFSQSRAKVKKIFDESTISVLTLQF